MLGNSSTDDLREEVGMKESFEETLVASRLEESRCTKSGG